MSPEQRTVQQVRVLKPELHPPAIDIQRIESLHLNSPKAATVSSKAKVVEPVPPKKTAVPVATAPEAEKSATRAKLKIASTTPVSFPRSASNPPVPAPSQNASSAPARLTSISPIVDAPAIGPKTAARFIAIGYSTVGHLLAGDPDRIAHDLETKWITSRLVTQWQDQARMACKVDRLTAVGSGLLMMVDVRTVESLAACTPSELYAKICIAAQTNDGQRLLRQQPPPSLQKLQEWIDSAKTGQGRGEPSGARTPVSALAS